MFDEQWIKYDFVMRRNYKSKGTGVLFSGYICAFEARIGYMICTNLKHERLLVYNRKIGIHLNIHNSIKQVARIVIYYLYKFKAWKLVNLQ